MDMRNTLNDINVIKDLTTAISHHHHLAQYYDRIVPQENFSKSNFYRTWLNVNVHIVDQMWGSTACGWGGMGGAAMTSKYNIIIEHPREEILFVYWDGKLAYILDSKDYSYDFGRMPSLDKVEALYKFSHQNTFNA